VALRLILAAKIYCGAMPVYITESIVNDMRTFIESSTMNCRVVIITTTASLF